MEATDLIQPHWEAHPNPAYRGIGYTHFEIQTVREYQAHDGDRHWETVTEPTETDAEDASSPVMYGVYGRCSWGGAEHIVDFSTLAEARRLLTMIGVPGLMS